MKLIFAFTLLSFSAFAQEDVYVPEKYSSTWVVRDLSDIRQRKEQFPVSSLPVAVSAHPDGVRLLIRTDSVFYRMANGNTFVRAFLINDSNTALSLPRQDAVLSQVSSEVRLGDTWKTLEVTSGSSCGNSYWKMSLEPHHFLYLHKDFSYLPGTIPVQYRIRLKTDRINLVSNEIPVMITPKQAEVARLN